MLGLKKYLIELNIQKKMIFIWYPNKEIPTVRIKSFGSRKYYYPKQDKIFAVFGKESMILRLVFFDKILILIIVNFKHFFILADEPARLF